MRLSELFREVEFDGSIKNDADINLVTDDSRLVRPGSLFVCIRHRSFDGHTAAVDALASGAAAVVTQDRLGLENELRVADSRSAYARLCAALCNHPERKRRMIGVTGTNGKTTVTTLVEIFFPIRGRKHCSPGRSATASGMKICRAGGLRRSRLSFIRCYRAPFPKGVKPASWRLRLRRSRRRDSRA